MKCSMSVTFLMGFAVGIWIHHKYFYEQRRLRKKSVTAAEQNSVPRTTPTVLPAEDDEESPVETRNVSLVHFLTRIESFSYFLRMGLINTKPECLKPEDTNGDS